MHAKSSTLRAGLIALFALSAFPIAHAGTVADGQWTPSGCGAKPQAPALDLRNADAFNKSTAAVNTYRQAIRPYLDCVVKEANGDVQAISKSATAIQQTAKDDNDKIQADAKSAETKFK